MSKPLDKNELSQKYLAFYLSANLYAFEISKVIEIVVLPEFTAMPESPKYMKGVINLRGQIIPIIDFGLALSMREADYDKQTCVIIVNMKINNAKKLVGFIVDNVSEVFEINSDDIESPSSYGNDSVESFLKGMAKVKDKIIMILEIDKILSKKETNCFELFNL